ncbi:MAG: VanZ family protein [Chlorobiales bacterium]|jgi:VanZ family protein|nr:VanZ family protein [Chlorobiales bacterium]
MSKKFWINQFPAILAALTIFVLSSIHGDSFPKVESMFAMDKLVHSVMYAGFTFVINHAFYHQNRYSYLKQNWIICSMLAAILFGISDETHQFFVPHRSCDVMDLNADLLGIFFATFVFWRFPTKKI